MVVVEMNHDARIIRLKDEANTVKPLPDTIEQWFGDSIGWWEGDTLVVETRNPHRLQASSRIPLSKEGKIIERFRQNVASHDFPQVGKVTVSVGFAADTPRLAGIC